MITIIDFDNFQYINKPINIALGNFDGIHIGHKTLISKLIEDSKKDNIPCMVYTFYNHPLTVINPDIKLKLITTNEQRISIFKKLGLDYLVLKTFDRKVMKMTPEQFIKDMILKRFNINCIYVGYNYTFGNNADGNIEMLDKLAYKYNFKIHITDQVRFNNTVVSSSIIRNCLKTGKIDTANKYLGRRFCIKGKVIHGEKIGSRLGIPTANIDYDKMQIIPQNGVYYTYTIIEGQKYKSLTNIGFKPTFNSNKLSIETHIINYKSDLYGKYIDILFNKKIRDEKKYATVDELVSQIKKDIHYILK